MVNYWRVLILAVAAMWCGLAVADAVDVRVEPDPPVPGESFRIAFVAQGEIESVSLRRRGQQRGKRLFRVSSVRNFLEKQMEAA